MPEQIKTLVLADGDTIRVCFDDVILTLRAVAGAPDDPRDYSMVLVDKQSISRNGDNSATICGKSHADRPELEERTQLYTGPQRVWDTVTPHTKVDYERTDSETIIDHCACGLPATVKKYHERYDMVVLQCARRTCAATKRVLNEALVRNANLNTFPEIDR